MLTPGKEGLVQDLSGRKFRNSLRIYSKPGSATIIHNEWQGQGFVRVPATRLVVCFDVVVDVLIPFMQH